MTGLPFAVPDVGPVANDDGGSPVGVGVEIAVPAPEHRLALAVVGVPVSAARARLGRAVRRDGDGGYAEFGGFLPQEFSDMADGRLGEAFVEFSLGGNVLARLSGCAAGLKPSCCGVEALDGYHLGLGFEQYLSDLSTHFLVAGVGRSRVPFSPMFGHCMAATLAAFGLAGDLVLVLAPALALFLGSRVVLSVS